MALSTAEKLVSVGISPEPARMIQQAIAGGTGAVTSVNGSTGAVVLDADDVGAVAAPDTPPAYSTDPEDIAAALVAAGLMAAE